MPVIYFLFPMGRFIFPKKYEMTNFFYKTCKKMENFNFIFKFIPSYIKILLEIVAKN